jgi:hypothetical protein
MFMQYSGGGFSHQNESSRWESADHGSGADEIIVDSDPEDYANADHNDSNVAKHHTLDLTLTHLPVNDNEGADTDDSKSTHSSCSDSSEEPFNHDTEDNEDDRTYFGPKDHEPIYAYDSDG